MAYLIKKPKFTRHQCGNRLFHSTETLSLHVTDHLFKAVDEKRITAMILIDLSKAFESLSHNLLLGKLQDMGTYESSTKWFESYLAERHQTTRIARLLAIFTITVCDGFPPAMQGSILGPLLFTLYINDLPNTV